MGMPSFSWILRPVAQQTAEKSFREAKKNGYSVFDAWDSSDCSPKYLIVCASPRITVLFSSV